MNKNQRRRKVILATNRQSFLGYVFVDQSDTNNCGEFTVVR